MDRQNRDQQQQQQSRQQQKRLHHVELAQPEADAPEQAVPQPVSQPLSQPVSSAVTAPLLLSAGLRLNTQAQSVDYAGQPLALKGLTFRLLHSLLSAQQQPLSAEQLAQQVWRKPYVSDETLAQRVSLLRKALPMFAGEVIESVRGEGYRWTLPVIITAELQPEPQPKPETVTQPLAQAAALIATQTTEHAFVHAALPKTLHNRRGGKTMLGLFVLSLLALLYLIASNQGLVADNSEQHGLARDDAAPLDQTPAGLVKAFAFAEQNNASGNAIAIDLFSEYLKQQPSNRQVRLALAAACIERVVKFNGEPRFLDLAAQQIAVLQHSGVAKWQLAKLQGYYFDARGDIDQAIYYYEQALAANSGQVSQASTDAGARGDSTSDGVTNPVVTGVVAMPLAPSHGAVKQIAASLAYLYVRKGRLYEALQLNLTALNRQQGYTLLQVSEILYLAGLREQSHAWVAVAYQFAPNDAFVAVQYAKDASARGDYATATQALHKLQQFHASTADSELALAELAVLQQQWPEAAQALVRAANLEPDSLYWQALQYWLSKQPQLVTVQPEQERLSLAQSGETRSSETQSSETQSSKTQSSKTQSSETQSSETQSIQTRPSTEASTPVWPNWYIAKCLVALTDGDFVMAKQALATAIAAGYMDLAYLQRMPGFAPLFNRPEFSELLAQLAHSVSTERTKILTVSLPEPAALMQAK